MDPLSFILDFRLGLTYFGNLFACGMHELILFYSVISFLEIVSLSHLLNMLDVFYFVIIDNL